MIELLKLKKLIKPYWWQISLAFLSLAMVTGLQLVIPTIIQQVIDEGLVTKEINLMIQAALIILLIGLARAIVSFFQRYLSEYVSMKIAYDLRNQLFNHIQNLSFSYHDHAQSGQLISRSIEDVGSIQRFFGFGAIELAQGLFMMIGTISLMFLDNAQLSIIALIPMLPLIWLTTNFGQRVSAMFYAIDKALGDLSSRLQENVTGAQVVRAFTRESYEISRFDKANKELFDARITVISEWSKIMPTTNMLVALSTILILWFGGLMVLDGTLTIGQIVKFNSYMLLLAGPAQQLTWLVNTAGEAAAGAQRAYEVLDHTPAIQSPKNAKSAENIQGHVEFKNIDFLYQGENKSALQNINLNATVNEVIALIGTTGSGKTSLVNLIPRFYDVSKGTLLIDGVDVRDYDLLSLRRQIGIVLQSSLLFSATIRENIALGRPDATENQIIAAAKAAQAHEFILNTPDGYETIVGERGITLSGGQRQRIAIARALLVNPAILILDDSTSSVDMETEHQIQQAMDSLMKDRTTFVIAQRLSTVKNADQILVLDKGQVVEHGKHADLLKLNGLYKEIYDLQLARQEQFRQEIAALENEENQGEEGIHGR